MADSDDSVIGRRWKPTIPAAVVIAGLLGLELAYGVSPGDAVLYCAYELTFVVVPGVLCYRALSSRPGSLLSQLAVGWGLGYALEILVFMITAATGNRHLFIAYPLVVGLAAGMMILRREDAGADAETSTPLAQGVRWLLAAAILIALAWFALAYYTRAPLPGGENVHYHQDLPWALSLAADAKHHWPIEDPNVSGLAMPYHYFVHLHMAAASQVTGQGLPLILFRLFPLPLVVLLAVQLFVAGRALRDSYTGVLAVGLALLVGQVNLAHDAPASASAFLGVFFTYLFASPSFLFGAVFLMALIILLGEIITRRAVSPATLGDWAIVVLLMVGASDTKVVILPMLAVSLLFLAGWRRLTRRPVGRAIPVATALAGLIALAVYFLQYRGHSSGLELDLAQTYGFFDQMMPAVAIVKHYLTGLVPSLPGAGLAISAVGIVFGIIGLYGAQLFGLGALVWSRGLRFSMRQAWLLCLLSSGVLAVLLLRSPGTGNQIYCLAYGLMAGSVVSADGLRTFWERRPNWSGRGRFMLIFAIGLLLLAAAMLLPARLESSADEASVARIYIISYGALALALAALVLAVNRWWKPGRFVAICAVGFVLLAAGLLDTPVESVEPALRPPGPPTSGRRVTPQLYEAMSWLRDNTPSDASIAVNNLEALEFDYAAFSERRTFLGGWGYSLPERERGYEDVVGGFLLGSAGALGIQRFSHRATLNKEVFERGNRSSASTLIRKYGVRYLLVDRVNGTPVNSRALVRIARPVFRTPQAEVLRLR